MTQQVHPTQGEASSQLTSGAIKWATLSDWIVPSGTDYLASFAGLTGTPLNGFQESHTASSLDVTVDTGEAFVGGRWCAKDTQTTVTLAASTTNQTIYLGWASGSANTVVIGLDSAFSASDDGRRTQLYECDTDGSGVTAVRSVHETEPIHPHAATADDLGGVGPEQFARLDQNETVNGSWAYAADILLNNNSLLDVHSVQSGETDARLNLNAGGADLALQTGGGGSGLVQVWDNSNTSSIAQFNEGGGVKFPNGDLETRRGWMVDHSNPISIEKDGTDRQGVINFKTQ